LTSLPPDEEPRGPDREEESADGPGGERPPGYTSDDLFDGVPPDEIGASEGDTGETGEEGLPELDPQFAEALREASGDSGDTAEYSVPDAEGAPDEGSDAEAAGPVAEDEGSDASAAGPVAEDVPPADSPEEASSTPPAEDTAETAEPPAGEVESEEEGSDAEAESEDEGSDEQVAEATVGEESE
jgi:hypothetical protein